MAGSVERVDVDVAVVGAGFAGSLAALALRRRGRRVALVERGRHPRFVIGESSTPLANLLLEEFGDRYGLPEVRAFSKWGTWRRTHPDVAVGLKRGFTFFFHRTGEAFGDDPDRERQLLVAASPFDEIADTHWYRPDFDAALARLAEDEGARYLDDTRLTRFHDEDAGVVLEGERHGKAIHVAARFVIDASGPRGCLHQLLGLQEAPLHWLPHTEALYAHFAGVARWDATSTAPHSPYPPDDAAVHHVFPGGWIWVLRFNNGITSAGAALTTGLASELRASEGAPAWDRLLERLPSVRELFADAHPVTPFVHAKRLAFRTGPIVGQKWALLPSAAGVIDPLLSTGFPLTLLGLGRLLEILESTAGGSEREAALGEYARVTNDELDATERLVAALYANMSEPATFKRLGLLYFAAASYSEAARRLGRPHLAPGFLLHAHPQFGPELRDCSMLALGRPEGKARHELLARIDRAIAPFDVAGLLDRTRRDWYPVRADDLFANAHKLDASGGEIQAMLERCGFGIVRAAPRD